MRKRSLFSTKSFLRFPLHWIVSPPEIESLLNQLLIVVSSFCLLLLTRAGQAPVSDA
jgi:hypothetical protein